MARLSVSRKNLGKIVAVHDLPLQHLPSPPWLKWPSFLPKWSSFYLFKYVTHFVIYIFASFHCYQFWTMRFLWQFEDEGLFEWNTKRFNPYITICSFSWVSLFFLSSLQTKKIGILATNRWGNDSPKFNTPETKVDLIKFCAEIAPECAIPEIDFNEEGIASQIKTFFVEQWRYKKNKNHPGIIKVGRDFVIVNMLTLILYAKPVMCEYTL